jgi:hypothetical protein
MSDGLVSIGCQIPQRKLVSCFNVPVSVFYIRNRPLGNAKPFCKVTLRNV